ncbi:MAG: class A beta-lactamase-related serine hydrolase, partial [Gammaproteobacteria bacterium]
NSFAHADPLVDPAQLERWADAYYGQAVAEKRSPGITISVVQDGEIILAKGYGYSDYGRRISVDPETSGFMTGSISKTFIATAIGQLVDRGAIASLDDPANRYLRRVQLPGDRGVQVTIRDLLTHRAGFEDVAFGSGLSEGRTVPVPLSAAEIRQHMPELVMEPGGASVYSNWGFAMLGFLIEDISGERLDTWLRKHIWAPLGMHDTGILYGDQWPDNLNTSYYFEKDGTPVARPIRGGPHPWIAAPGMVVSTARDMARYMNAHLFEGEDGGQPLLSREMFRELHTEWVRNAPGGAGFAGSFFTGKLNGAPTIEHGGSTFDTHSMMTMIPARRFGFFVAAMQGGLAPWAGHYSPEEIDTGQALVRQPLTPAELRESFIDQFLQRPVEVARGRQLELHKLVGSYRATRRPYTTIAVISEAFDPAAVQTIALAGDGQGLLLNGAGPYTQLGDGLFRSPSGENEWTDPYTIDHRLPPHFAFNVDAAGNPVSLVVGHGDQVWVPANPIFNTRILVPAAAILGLIAASGLLLFAWPQRRRFASPTNYLGLAALLLVLVIPGAMMLGFAREDSIVVQAILGR